MLTPSRSFLVIRFILVGRSILRNPDSLFGIQRHVISGSGSLQQSRKCSSPGSRMPVKVMKVVDDILLICSARPYYDMSSLFRSCVYVFLSSYSVMCKVTICFVEHIHPFTQYLAFQIL